MTEEKESYKQIFKSTGIIGGSQVIVILIGLIRTKIAAVILGPFGYGIVGSLQATVDLMRQATGFGINVSAVREISHNMAGGNQWAIARIITIAKRWGIYTGILGTVITLLFCIPLSKYAFDNEEYAVSIALISVILLITAMSGIQMSILQGFRQLRKMALSAIYGALLGTCILLPLYILFDVKGIVPGMIISALIGWLISWYYARGIKTDKIRLTFRETITGGIGIAKLGFLLSCSAFVAALIMYAVRAFIVRQLDMDAVGNFQSAWNIANTYMGLVLGAMGTDFFPRLSGIHSDNAASNKLINQQLKIALLIMVPLLIIMIGAADVVIPIFYSSKFSPAIPLLQLQLYGGFFFVIAWCLGVMFLAKNKVNYSLITDVIWGVIYLLFILITWKYLGFMSLGAGYIVASTIKTVIVYFLARKLGNFRFEKQIVRDIAVFILLISVATINVFMLKGSVQHIISLTIATIAVVYSYRKLNDLIEIKQILSKIFKLK